MPTFPENLNDIKPSDMERFAQIRRFYSTHGRLYESPTGPFRLDEGDPKQCRWVYDPEDECWHTECGEVSYCLEKWFVYCPGCGNEILEVER